MNTEPARHDVGEVRREQRDVLAPLAQRRHVHREHREPVKEIRAKPAALHLAREVAVGRGDHAHVDAVHAIAADALDLALLQRAQQLRLQLQRQLADLVEEQRAAVGDLELAGPIALRAGERARHVPEQLALGDADRQRGAVDVDERLVGARARRRGSGAPPAPCRRRSRPVISTDRFDVATSAISARSRSTASLVPRIAPPPCCAALRCSSRATRPR